MAQKSRFLQGTLRVTASGAVRVAVTGVGKLSFAGCLPVNGTEVEVQWPNATSTSSTSDGSGGGSGSEEAAGAAGQVGSVGAVPLAEFVGGAVGLSFEVPAGSILYAYHA